MILTLILILIIFSIYISIHFKSKIFTALIFAFFVGLILMVISNALYYIHRGLYSHAWLLNNRLLSRLISVIPFSFSTTRIISLVGETITMYTLVLFYLVTAKTKLRTYIIFGVFVMIYFIINLPNFTYSLAIAIAQSQNITFFNSYNVYTSLSLIHKSIVASFFIMPFVMCLCRYRNKKFIIIKRKIIILGLALLIMETVLILLIFTNYINSFFSFTTDIFYVTNANNEIINDYLMIAIVLIFLTVFSYLIYKSKFFTPYFIPSLDFITNKVKNMDLIIRMILHTYKNMFLSINQLSTFAQNSNEVHSEYIDECLRAISDISETSLKDITHQLNMLGSPDIVLKNVDIYDIITQAVERITEKNGITFNIHCRKGEFYIQSDAFYLVEMIYNILINSYDAVKAKSTGEITVHADREDSWILLEITDNGCGMSKKYIRHIFDPLVSHKLNKNSWGIGLYYVKKIVTAHKGYIFIDKEKVTLLDRSPPRIGFQFLSQITEEVITQLLGHIPLPDILVFPLQHIFRTDHSGGGNIQIHRNQVVGDNGSLVPNDPRKHF